jgi:DNA-binding GntR family transcriptional regulator
MPTSGPIFENEPLAPLGATATLADQVADRIVEAIAARHLVSGQRLIETELADALQVSRVPVREAMRILASQGIIVPAPRRGMRVATFDAAWATQLHNARVAIERLCARIVADKLAVDGAPLCALEARVAEIDAATRRSEGSWLGINRADIAFHDTMFKIADSPLLTTLWTAISRHVLIMFSIETYRDTDFARVTAEHRAYIEALLSGSPARLDEEIDLHVAGLRTFARAAPLPEAPQETGG